MNKTITWWVDGVSHVCTIEIGACPACGAEDTVTSLPEPIREDQPDHTTHVCNPALGGCNHGYTDDRYAE